MEVKRFECSFCVELMRSFHTTHRLFTAFTSWMLRDEQLTLCLFQCFFDSFTISSGVIPKQTHTACEDLIHYMSSKVIFSVNFNVCHDVCVYQFLSAVSRPVALWASVRGSSRSVSYSPNWAHFDTRQSDIETSTHGSYCNTRPCSSPHEPNTWDAHKDTHTHDLLLKKERTNY